MPKTKLYCVHVYEIPHKYENIKAKSPEEAERKVVQQEWAGDYDSITEVEVMRQCECGYDNAKENKKCDECGKKL